MTRDSHRRIIRLTSDPDPNRGNSPSLSFLRQTASDPTKSSPTRTFYYRHNQRTLLPLLSILLTENFSRPFFLITSPDTPPSFITKDLKKKTMHSKPSPVWFFRQNIKSSYFSNSKNLREFLSQKIIKTN